MADTDDPTQLKMALELAEQYSIDTFEIRSSFMENFMLTTKFSPNFHELLDQFDDLRDHKDFVSRLDKFCYPNIKGTDHFRLLAFWELLQKASGQGQMSNNARLFFNAQNILKLYLNMNHF